MFLDTSCFVSSNMCRQFKCISTKRHQICGETQLYQLLLVSASFAFLRASKNGEFQFKTIDPLGSFSLSGPKNRFKIPKIAHRFGESRSPKPFNIVIMRSQIDCSFKKVQGQQEQQGNENDEFDTPFIATDDRKLIVFFTTKLFELKNNNQ